MSWTGSPPSSAATNDAMLPRHRQLFLDLSPQAAEVVWELVRKRHQGLPPVPQVASGPALFEACWAASLHHAEVVMSLAREHTVLIEEAIETLIGHPITRRRVELEVVRRHRTRRSDPRTITVLVENPKKPGSLAHALFSIYMTGMSVDDFIRAGGTRAAIRYDSEHGFISLTPP